MRTRIAVVVAFLLLAALRASAACTASVEAKLKDGIVHNHRILTECLSDPIHFNEKILNSAGSCMWGDCGTAPPRSCPAHGACDEDIVIGCWPEGEYTIQVDVWCSSVCEPSIPGYGSFTVSREDDRPVLNVHPPKSLGGNMYRITVDYHFPGLGSRSVSADWVPSKDFAGAQITINPTLQASGQFFFDVPAQQYAEALQITARGSCGTVATDCTLIPQRKCEDCRENCPSPATCKGGPVRMSSGNMRYTEDDLLPSSDAARLVRTYDSSYDRKGLFGTSWSSLLDSWCRFYTAGDRSHSVIIGTPENDRVMFSDAGGSYIQTWPMSSRASGAVSVSGSTVVYTDRAARTVSTFRLSDGVLLSRQSLATGRQLTISWDANSLPTRADDSWGAFAWIFTTNSASRLITGVTVEGTSISRTYAYTSDALTSVTVSGTPAWRTYAYTGGRLSEIRDALGHLVESHTYAASSEASDSRGQGGEIDSIAYGLPSSRSADETITRVTWVSGRQVDYYIRPIAGDSRMVEVAGGCSSCSGEDAVYGYDDFGNVIRKQDARGYLSTYTFDPTGKLLISQTDSLRRTDCNPAVSSSCRLTPDQILTAQLTSTPATITRSYEYGDTNWPTRPTRITMPSVHSPTPDFRSEILMYDQATGEVTYDTHLVWLGLGYVYTDALTTITTLYNGTEGAAFSPCSGMCAFLSSWETLAQPHLRKSVNGPRTDVSDVVQYVYYPIHSSVPGVLRGHLAAVGDAKGLVTRFEDYDAFGHARRVIDPNGVVTEQSFDTLGRLLTTTVKGETTGCDTSVDPTCATDLTTTNGYYPGGGPLQTTTRPGGGVTTYVYDDRMRVQSMTRTVGSGIEERIAYDYDTSGRKSAEHYLAGTSGSFAEKRVERFFYDQQDRLSEARHADNTSMFYAYDVAGQLIGSRNESHTEADTFYEYDAAGRLQLVRQKLGTGYVVTTYAYDIHGNLTSVTDPNGNVTSYVYDDMGRMLQQTSPVTGVTTYAYDNGGNLTSTSDANGATTARTYDESNRVLSASSTRGASTEAVTWTYDDGTPGNHGRGRLSVMSDPAGTTLYAYERRGMLRAEIRSFPGVTDSYITQYAYDADGNRMRVSYPSGLVATYGYDLAGRPSSVSTAQANVITTASYLPFGPVTNLTFPGGFHQDFAYDTRYRMTDESVMTPFGYFGYHHYLYDDLGKTMTIQDWTVAAYNRSFVFDDLNRLVSSTSGSSLWGTAQYQYDAMGNIQTQTIGSRQTTFTYNGATPRLSSVTENGSSQAVTYDSGGNETAWKLTRTYSPRNFMATMQQPAGSDPHVVAYTYDGRGVRVTRSERSVGAPASSALMRLYTYTPELRLLSYTKDDTNWTATHADRNTKFDVVWFGDRPVAEIRPDHLTIPFYTYTDHLGTPYMQTDTIGDILWWAEYEPYGNVWSMRVAPYDTQLLRFPGQEAETTWEGAEERYNVFRWYRSGWGRYTSPDPIELLPGPNLYSYTFGNPIRYSDRFGLFRAPMPTPTVPYPQTLPPPGCSPAPPSWGPGTVGGVGTVLWAFFFDPPALNQTGAELPDPTPGHCRGCPRGSEDDRDDRCYDQWIREDRQCQQWWRGGSKIVQDYQRACRQSAFTRYSECLRHGTPRSPLSPRPDQQ